MKKILLIILSVVVVAAGATVAVLSTNKSTFVQRDKIEDALFCYLNLDQLAKKGAFEKYITPEQRKMWASMATANIEDDAIAENIKSIITDFNNFGADLSKPLYAYADEVHEAFVVVAEVADKNVVEKSVGNIAFLIDKHGNTTYELEQDRDGGRLIFADKAALAYSDKHIVMVFREDGNVVPVLEEAYTRPLADFSMFGDSDIAMYINVYKLLNFGKQYIDKEIALYSDENVNHIVAELNNEKLLLEEWSTHITPDAHIISSLTFEAGRIVATNNCYNFNTERFEGLLKKCNNDHLEYISEDAIAVLNFGLEGQILSELITEFINSDLSNILGINLYNEERMALAVACDAIESINGDTTIVLESIDGTLRERFNYYTGDVNYLPEMKSFKAAMMMDVSDSYIITNVGQYAMGLLLKVDDNHYASQFGNYNITLLQRDNLLFGGVNMKPTKAENPASNAVWAKDVEESYGYAVINFNSLRESKFTGSIYDILIEELGLEYDNTLHSLKEMLSYAYTTSEDILCNKSVVVLNDESTNSLEQFTSILIPVIISEMNASIF